MPTYQKCPKEVCDMANAVLTEFESHKPILDARVRIDFVFAFPEVDEASGEYVGDAIRFQGYKALGVAKIVNAKDRVKGLGDAEILLDAAWWDKASEIQKRSLLDHELTHINVVREKSGLRFKLDEIGRPKLKMRKHDVQVGWFKDVAERHGIEGIEQAEAKLVMDNYGQFFWPGMLQHPTPKAA